MTTDTTPLPTVKAADSTLTSNSKMKEGPADQYRMVALDLDGTLLNSQHKLSEATANYLRYLDQKGFVIIIATGRAICTVYDTIKALNLPKPLPVVCSNGAEGYLCSVVENGQKVEKQLLFSTPVPEAVAKRTLELSKELGCVAQYYVGENVYADPREEHHYVLTGLYKELTGSKTIYVTDDFQQAWKQGLPSKQLVLCPIKDQDRMMEVFQTEMTKDAYLVNGKPTTLVRGNLGWFMEVLHPDVQKGNGLRLMCQQLNIRPEDCIAFGDGDNDFEFLQFAGKGIAMKNARDVVKTVANEVIAYSNDEDGVIRTLKAMEGTGCLVFPGK